MNSNQQFGRGIHMHPISVMIKSLILDLDDTIFTPRSIDSKVVKPFFDALRRTNNVLTEENLELAIEEIHRKPFNLVADHFGFSKPMITESLNVFNKIELNMVITPYDDYTYLKDLSLEKFLVTTGIRKFQLAKIESLHITNDFKEIFIDDPMERLGGKKSIFMSILKKYEYAPKELLVIGDSIESEIKAGKELGMHTLMICRDRIAINSDPEIITSFSEIEDRIIDLN